jgi:preprotein translocase subunit YajC
MESLMLIVILVVMGVMFFFTSRGARKRQAEADTFRSRLGKGDEVMTGSGLIGVIEAVDVANNSVIINSEGTRTRWLLDAVQKLPKTVNTKALSKSAKSAPVEDVEVEEVDKTPAVKKPAAKKPAAKKAAVKIKK